MTLTRSVRWLASLAALGLLVACGPTTSAERKVTERSTATGATQPTATARMAQLPPISTGAPGELRSVDQDMRARANGDAISKIYDGAPVAAGTFSATVGITAGVDRRPACTGVLIKPDVVLTAAHCVCGVVARPDLTPDANVYVGDNPTVLKGLFYRVTAFESAIACNGRELAYSPRQNRDLAVLRLKAPVAGVTPISYAADKVVDGATSYRVVGFGAIDTDGKVFTFEKREAAVVAVSNDCKGHKDGQATGPTDGDYYGCWPSDEVVAGQRRSPDACSGDSGGPLLVSEQGKGAGVPASQYLLAGITSRSVDKSLKACGYGGIYERMTPGAQVWITAAIARLKH